MSSRLRTAIAGLVLVAALTGAVGCGGDSPASGDATTADYEGALAKPQKPVPPLALDNYQGQPVNIDQFAGKAVLVTFVYSHCPDVCPLIVGNLHAALQQLGPEASKVQIIAVSTDPEGDTPQSVSKFLKDRQMAGEMDWLLGSRSQLEKTWKAWGIAVHVPKSDPELVEHSAEVFGISSGGEVTTLYPANFKPKWIVNDVPLLASS